MTLPQIGSTVYVPYVRIGQSKPASGPNWMTVVSGGHPGILHDKRLTYSTTEQVVGEIAAIMNQAPKTWAESAIQPTEADLQFEGPREMGWAAYKAMLERVQSGTETTSTTSVPFVALGTKYPELAIALHGAAVSALQGVADLGDDSTGGGVAVIGTDDRAVYFPEEQLEWDGVSPLTASGWEQELMQVEEELGKKSGTLSLLGVLLGLASVVGLALAVVDRKQSKQLTRRKQQW